MKYTVSMKMERKEIMEIHKLLGDFRVAFSWGMMPAFTSENSKEFEKLSTDICNWLDAKDSIEGMDLVMLEWAIHALECMSRKLYEELEEARAYKRIIDIKERFLSIRRTFSMEDRSC